MLSKRAMPEGLLDADPSKRLRINLADLLLSNDVSGVRAQTLFDDGVLAGAEHLEDLSKAGNKGKSKGNCARDLTRRLLRRNKWPGLYYARIRVWDKYTQLEKHVWLPMFLPHELLAAIVLNSDLGTLLSQEGMANDTRMHMVAAAAELGRPQLLGIGLWGDGVPCNWDRTQSLEVFTMNFPGLSGKWKDVRLPLAVINKKFVVKEHTFDDILSVVTWSLRALAANRFPSSRHDRTTWTKLDVKRKHLCEKPIGVYAVLAEVRGDWIFYQSTFRLPAHNAKAGCCWLCRATPATIRECGTAASWRQERMSHWDLLLRWQEQGKSVSPLLGAPCIRSSCFKIDWLHTVDLGVAADFLGSIFKMLLPKMQGASDLLRCKELFLLMQTYYRANNVESRLDHLTPLMLCKPMQTPKLRAKAAEARGLVPFARDTALLLLSDAVPTESTAKEAAICLASCYDALSHTTFLADDLKKHCRKFCLLTVALEAADEKLWRVKPKLHLFQELCEMQTSCPADSWTYRDEDFGGTLAKISRRRGGNNSALGTGRSVLQKFAAKHAVPAILPVSP